jgi:hypothetical protein
MALSGSVTSNLSFTQTSIGDALGAGTFNLAVLQAIALANGVAINQADVIYKQAASILTAATLSLDLKGGGLLDVFGVAINPVKLVGIYIFSKLANTTNLTLFGDANSVPILNTAATTVTLKPGGKFELWDPSLAAIPVTAATGDIIKIVNAAGATALVDIVLVARSA